jgi:hypothetical protein
MNARLVRIGLWITTVAGLAVTFTVLRDAGRNSSPAIPQMPRALLVPPRASAELLEQAVSDVAERNLFRPERAMAEASSAPMAAIGPTMGVPAPMTPGRPRLTLRGVLGGPPWDALIEGIPGREGAVVMRAGETQAGVTIRAIRRDTVLARGFDTTWALTLARSW